MPIVRFLFTAIGVATVGLLVPPASGASVELVSEHRVARTDARLPDDIGVRSLRDRIVPRPDTTREIRSQIFGNSPNGDVSGRASSRQQADLRIFNNDQSIRFGVTLNASANISPGGLLDPNLGQGAISGATRTDLRIRTDDLLSVRVTGNGSKNDGARVAFRAFGNDSFDFTLAPPLSNRSDSFSADAILFPGRYRIFAEVVTAGGPDSRFAGLNDGEGRLSFTLTGNTIPPNAATLAPHPAAIGPGLMLLAALILKRPRKTQLRRSGHVTAAGENA